MKEQWESLQLPIKKHRSILDEAQAMVEGQIYQSITVLKTY